MIKKLVIFIYFNCAYCVMAQNFQLSSLEGEPGPPSCNATIYPTTFVTYNGIASGDYTFTLELHLDDALHAIPDNSCLVGAGLGYFVEYISSNCNLPYTVINGVIDPVTNFSVVNFSFPVACGCPANVMKVQFLSQTVNNGNGCNWPPYELCFQNQVVNHVYHCEEEPPTPCTIHETHVCNEYTFTLEGSCCTEYDWDFGNDDTNTPKQLGVPSGESVTVTYPAYCANWTVLVTPTITADCGGNEEGETIDIQISTEPLFKVVQDEVDCEQICIEATCATSFEGLLLANPNAEWVVSGAITDPPGASFPFEDNIPVYQGNRVCIPLADGSTGTVTVELERHEDPPPFIDFPCTAQVTLNPELCPPPTDCSLILNCEAKCLGENPVCYTVDFNDANISAIIAGGGSITVTITSSEGFFWQSPQGFDPIAVRLRVRIYCYKRDSVTKFQKKEQC